LVVGGQECLGSINGIASPPDVKVRVPAGNDFAIGTADVCGGSKTVEPRCDLGSDQDLSGADSDNTQTSLGSGTGINMGGATAVTIPKPGGAIRWQCTPVAGIVYEYLRLVAIHVGTRH